ncbi:hypothetical protein N6H14_33140 [Paenibacillus sp. CC-CFT747]|nr:hypothetical protein N6H14_33140 [Paenibacillus sp. CC-CFT747]
MPDHTPALSLTTRSAPEASGRPMIETSRTDRILFTVVTLLYWAALYVYVPILSPISNTGGFRIP